jgi:putative ABC transport system permease protein
MLLLAFAMLAVLLAGVGVFGVVSYAVTNRTRELGVRLALGASPGALRRLVLAHVLGLVGGGLALGLPLALAAGHLLRAMLFGVTEYDGSALAAASGLALVAGIAAGGWPAWRAGRTDAAAILRGE